MRTTTAVFFTLLMAATSFGATVYTFPSAGLAIWKFPDLNEPGFAAVTGTLTTNDVDQSIDYDLTLLGESWSGTLTHILPDTVPIPGFSPQVVTWADGTGGTGPHGGHMNLQLVSYDAAVGYDPDDLFGGRDAGIVVLGTEFGGDPAFATISVPEPGTITLASMAGLAILYPLRRRRKNRMAQIGHA